MKYQVISQKPYCCVPANLQIILKSHSIRYDSQEKIGKELGLVRPGNHKKPLSGWGTQVGIKKYSLNNYFQNHQIPLRETYYYITDTQQIKKQLKTWLDKKYDIIGCADWGTLHNKNITNGHVFLIESIENNCVVIIDTELKTRIIISLKKLAQAIKKHSKKRRAGFWIIKPHKSETYQLGIYVDLPKQLETPIFDIKKYLAQVDHNIYNQKPHISIYTSAFKKKNFNILIKQISKLQLKSFYVKIHKLQTTSHKNDIFYSLNITPNTNLIKLHYKILPIANKLRSNQIRIKDILRINSNFYSQKEIKIIKKYGFLRVKTKYTPHITLGLIKNLSIKDKKIINTKLLEVNNRKFLIEKITVGLFKENKLKKPILIRKINLVQ